MGGGSIVVLIHVGSLDMHLRASTYYKCIFNFNHELLKSLYPLFYDGRGSSLTVHNNSYAVAQGIY